MIISLIAAVASNNVIGCDNKIPWHLPEDLKYFKSVTMNKPMIMGRKTFESLPGVLPKREHIVISRNPNSNANKQHPHVHWVTSFDAAIDYAKQFLHSQNQEIMVIGGGQIYQQAISIAERIYLTRLDKEYSGNVKFPDIDLQFWKLSEQQEKCSEKYPDITYKIQLYTRDR
jgi:dihydrofolate reductase